MFTSQHGGCSGESTGLIATIEDFVKELDTEMTEANAETALTTAEDTHTSTVKELMATEEYISSFHGECDWLIKFDDVRKEARIGEIDTTCARRPVLAKSML